MDECLARADQADAKIAKLHQTVDEITKILAQTPAASSSGGGEELEKFQRSMLQRLVQLRETLDQERTPLATLQQERDAAVAAKEQLEEQVGKQKYRIGHLVRALDPSAGGGAPNGGSTARDASLRKGSCLAGGAWL